MLLVTRRVGERICIDHGNGELTWIEIKEARDRQGATLAIEAPDRLRILRSELTRHEDSSRDRPARDRSKTTVVGEDGRLVLRPRSTDEAPGTE